MEIKIVSYGLLTLGGVASLILGSILLFRSGDQFMNVSLPLIITTGITIGLVCGFLVIKARNAMKRYPTSGHHQILKEIGIVKEEVTSTGGQVFIHSEYWNARTSGSPIAKGERVCVKLIDGRTLEVAPVEQHLD